MNEIFTIESSKQNRSYGCDLCKKEVKVFLNIDGDSFIYCLCLECLNDLTKQLEEKIKCEEK